MLLQISVRGKVLPANMAPKRSCARMFPLVDGEVHLGVVPFEAAGVLTLVAVVLFSDCALCILRFLSGLLGAVDMELLVMGFQMALEFELFLADVTGERP